MTDARFPERWLNDRRIQQLPPEAFVAFANALMWSVSNRTDGIIKFTEWELIPRCKPADAAALESAGLLKRRNDGWLLGVYKATQRSRKQLESDDEYRERERERMAQKRAEGRLNALNNQDVRTDVRANERADNIGQDRAGPYVSSSSSNEKKKTQRQEQSRSRENVSREGQSEAFADYRRRAHEDADPAAWESRIRANTDPIWDQ
jgi:hypothetical protein